MPSCARRPDGRDQIIASSASSVPAAWLPEVTGVSSQPVSYTHLIFMAAIAVGRHLIEAERNRPLPPAPVYLQNIEEPRQSAPPQTTAAAQREPGATPP